MSLNLFESDVIPASESFVWLYHNLSIWLLAGGQAVADLKGGAVRSNSGYLETVSPFARDEIGQTRENPSLGYWTVCV